MVLGKREELISLWPFRAEQGPGGGGKSQGQTGTRNSKELSNRQSCPKRTGVQLPSLDIQAEINDHSDRIGQGGSLSERDVQLTPRSFSFPAEWLEAKS